MWNVWNLSSMARRAPLAEECKDLLASIRDKAAYVAELSSQNVRHELVQPAERTFRLLTSAEVPLCQHMIGYNRTASNRQFSSLQIYDV
jgi:hypothetical protein